MSLYVKIRNALYILLAVMSFLLVFAILLLLWRQKEFAILRDKSLRLHLGSMAAISVMERETHKLKNSLLAPPTDVLRRASTLLNVSLHVLAENLANVHDLQDHYGEAEFEQTLTAAERQYKALADAVAAGNGLDDPMRSRIATIIRSLALTLTQLARLHAIEYAMNESRYEDRLVQTNTAFFLVLALGVGVAVFLAIFFVRQINTALTRLEVAERALHTANTVLESRVEQRTTELRAAQEELLRKERLSTIGQIAGSIAHELRNPLGAVKQSLFFLTRLSRKQQLDATNLKVPEHLQLMETEIDTANQVINRLLDSARNYPQQPEWVDRRMLLDDAVQREHWGEQMQLMLTCEPDPFVFWADWWQMQHVFMNLLSNAADACEQSGRVTIRAHVDTAAQQYQMTVHDTGCGIPADKPAQVFEPLYSNKVWGTGLGLSLCKKLVEQQGGQITLNSQEGQGTTVSICLPLPLSPDIHTGEAGGADTTTSQ